jgi:hypothetical protein
MLKVIGLSFTTLYLNPDTILLFRNISTSASNLRGYIDAIVHPSECRKTTAYRLAKSVILSFFLFILICYRVIGISLNLLTLVCTQVYIHH